MNKKNLLKPIVLGIMILLFFSQCQSGGKKNEINRKKTNTNEISQNTFVKPIINVYIENSGSMDGYVKGVTEFEQTVYSYLSDIKISDLTDSLNLLYINSKTIPWGSDIADFIEKLEPATFRLRGGNRQTTDISDLLKIILSETKENHVSIFISDCIFSPGKSRNAEQYLVNQQIGIKTNMAEYLKKHTNTAVCVYQFSSQFDGFYYNRYDKPTKIKDNRPFYIWIIGDKQYIAELSKKVPESKFKGSGVQNLFTITQGNQKVDYAIRIGSGKFELDKSNPKTAIKSAKKDYHSKKLSFVVEANLSTFLLNDNYLKDIENYELNDKDYQLQIANSSNNGYGYTHSLKLSSDIVKSSNLSIKLKTNVPRWVEEINDEEGINIKADGAMGKTFGIKYLINGVYEAFTQKNEYYTDIKISVNN